MSDSLYSSTPVASSARRITRTRPHLSCTECIRRKIKCDRKQPCAPCSTRDRASDCVFQLPAALKGQARKRKIPPRDDDIEQDELEESSDGDVNESPPASSLFAASLSLTRDIAGAFELTRSRPAYIHRDTPSPRLHATQRETNMQPAEPAMSSVENLIATGQTRAGRYTVEAHSLAQVDPILQSLFATGEAFPTASSARVLKSRVDPTYERLLDTVHEGLPRSKDLLDLLVTRYFTHTAWHWLVLHQPSFEEEYQAFKALIEQGRRAEVDPVWMACLCMVLATAADTFDVYEGLIALATTKDELRDLPKKLYILGEAALACGDWTGTPRLRVLQAISLMTSHLLYGPPSRLDLQGVKLEKLNVCAIRICQELRMHQIPDDPYYIPSNDPDYTSQTSSLRRQMPLRLLFAAMAIDQEATQYPPILDPSDVSSAFPGNYEDSQLSMYNDDMLQPRPHLTDVSFIVLRFEVACLQRRYHSLIQGHKPRYQELVDMDRRLTTLYKRYDLEEISQNQSQSRRWACQLALLEFHARRIKFHRPYVAHSLQLGPEHDYLKKSLLHSARALIRVCLEMKRLGAPVVHGPVHFMQLQSAVFVLAQASWRFGVKVPSDQESDDQLIVASLQLFKHYSQSIRPHIERAAKIGASVLQLLYNTIMDRRKFSGLSESFGHALKRISQTVSREHEHSTLDAIDLFDFGANDYRASSSTFTADPWLQEFMETSEGIQSSWNPFESSATM